MASITKHANSDIVSVLKPGSEVLKRVQDEFHGLLRRCLKEGSEIAITCFFEELPVLLVGKVRHVYIGIPCYSLTAFRLLKRTLPLFLAM